MPGVADLTIGAPGAPEVEPEAAELDAALADAEITEPPQVDPSVVRGLLASAGVALGHVAGDDDVEGHWRFTSTELDDLTPPLTRIVNRNPRLRRAVMRGDELTVAVLLAGYTGRNVALAREAKEARDEQPGEAAPSARPVESDGGAPPGVAGGNGLHGGSVPGPAAGGVL
jgi:hypothetical protein